MARIKFELGQVCEKTQDYNLTELNAFEDVMDRGFCSHNDWCSHIIRYGYVAKWLIKLAKDLGPLQVLDLGCGQLNQLRYLARNRTPKDTFLCYRAVDLRAKESWCDDLTWSPDGDLYLIRSDFVKEPLETFGVKSNDVVICTEAFEHIPIKDQPTLIERMRDCLRPGGVAFLSTPNAGVSDSAADNHHGEDGECRERTLDDKLAMCKAAGFVVDECWGTFAGTTRLPPLHDEHPGFAAMKKYLPPYWYTAVVAAAYAEKSNNAIMKLTKPE